MADQKLGSDPADCSPTTTAETPTGTLAETPTETATETATETPTETATETPTEAETDTSSDAPSQAPTEVLKETPTETPSEAPTGGPTEAPPSLDEDNDQVPTPVAQGPEGEGGPQDAVPNGVGPHLSDGDSASLSSQATQKRLSKIPEEGDTGACRDQADERTELLEKRQSQVVVSNGDVTVHVVPDATEDAVAKEREAGRGSAPRRALMWLKKNEFLILLIGSVTLFLGCILLAVGGYMMRAAGTCSTAALADSHAHLADGSHFHVDVDGYVGYSNPYEGETNSSGPGNDTQDEVRENLAVGRPAYQSTAFSDDGQLYPADLAVDDSSDFNFKDGSCARTERETLPYWYVDLGESHRVRSVHIMLPTDCCIAELHNFEVRVGQREDRLGVNSLCRYYMGTTLRSTIKVTCESPLVGRYVSIQMLGDETRPVNRLNLCEVRVYS